LADALRERGRKVIQFHEIFKDPETKDRVWMQDICARGYVIITKDKNLLSKTNALMIWHRAKGKIFQIGSGTANREQLIFALLTALRKMEKVIDQTPPPFMVTIHITGDVELIRPENLDLDFLK
jgi:hypothetical protein